MGDGGAWLRRQCLLLAQTNYTPAGYWLDLPLCELSKWIVASNSIVEERRRKQKRKR